MDKSRYNQRYRRVLHALRLARKAAALTQTQVAKKFRAHASFVSKVESGERRLDVIELEEFCRIYGVSLTDFLKSALLEQP